MTNFIVKKCAPRFTSLSLRCLAILNERCLVMKIIVRIGLIVVFFAAPVTSHALECAKPPQQVQKTVKNDFELEIKALKRWIGEAGLGVETDVIVDNLYAKYPNADKLILAQMFMSLFCSLLEESKDLSSEKKFELFSESRDRVMNLMTGMPATQPSFTAHEYITEIRWRVDMASERVELGRSRKDKRAAAREAWQALSGEQPEFYSAAYPAMGNLTLMELLGGLRKLSSKNKQNQIDTAYEIASEMATIGPTLLYDEPFKTTREKARWAKAFARFACDPNKSKCEPEGLWPRFKRLKLLGRQ